MEGQKPIVKKEFLVLGFIVVLVLAGTLLFIPKNSGVDTKKVETPTAPRSSIPTSEQPRVYFMEEVNSHADATSCWTVIRGNVYDATSAIDKHKGGRDKILSLCGTDATSAFENQHGGQEKPESWLDTLKIGTLKK